MFSCEFCEIFKNTFFTNHVRKTASVCNHLLLAKLVQTSSLLNWSTFHSILLVDLILSILIPRLCVAEKDFSQIKKFESKLKNIWNLDILQEIETADY